MTTADNNSSLPTIRDALDRADLAMEEGEIQACRYGDDTERDYEVVWAGVADAGRPVPSTAVLATRDGRDIALLLLEDGWVDAHGSESESRDWEGLDGGPPPAPIAARIDWALAGKMGLPSA